LKHLLSIADLTASESRQLIAEAIDLKAKGPLSILAGRTLALLFEKPSLRTKVSFDVAMYQLGGHALYLSPQEVGVGQREAVKDVAAVLSRYVDGIVARLLSSQLLHLLAQHATVPVINGLSEEEHPVQALSDVLTIFEAKGRLEGLTLAYLGDGNNVAQSLVLAASQLGLHTRLACPQGYGISPQILDQALRFASSSGATVTQTTDPQEGIRDADIVYTDVWYSMGREDEKETRCRVFQPYQVNARLLALAKDDAIVMHNMPAHRGEEITDEVIDGPHSLVLAQAENRLHMQKAILVRLLG
jgi:ornithine carbamoyltransferase